MFLPLPICQSFLSTRAYHSINVVRPCLALFSYCILDCIFLCAFRVNYLKYMLLNFWFWKLVQFGLNWIIHLYNYQFNSIKMTYLEVAKSEYTKGQINHMLLVIALLYYNQKTWQSDCWPVKDETYVKITQLLRTHTIKHYYYYINYKIKVLIFWIKLNLF